MVNYNSQYQSKLESFCNIHQLKLNPNNRWVKLAHTLPWDMLVKIYCKQFSNLGSRANNPRVVIGSFIVKHKLNLSDEETVITISENPYIQYFLGYDEFICESPYSATSLEEIRKKIDKEIFDEFWDALIRVCFPSKIKTREVNDDRLNKGKLKLDATVADPYIRYPNDLGLLNEGRLIPRQFAAG